MKSAISFSILILTSNLLYVLWLGTDVPFWDQWDSEAHLYIKWLSGTLTGYDLVAPHVQHRFALSRVLRLALFEMRGGWSPLSNMLAQCVLAPLIFLTFYGFLKDRLVSRWRLVLFYAIATVLFLSPLYWELMLVGFQSHFYLSVVFAFLLIRISAGPPRISSIAWFSVIGLLNTFTSAVSPIPLVVSLIVQVAALVGFQQYKSRLSFVQIGVSVILLILNFFLMVTPDAGDTFGARGAGNFLWLSLTAFSWPTEYLGIICLWLLPLFMVIRGHRGWKIHGLKNLVACIYRDRTNLALCGLLVWIVLSVASIAYARGNLSLFASRYMFTYGFTLYVPFLSYLLFFDGVMEFKLSKRTSGILLATYFLLFIGLSIGIVKELNKAIQYKTDMDTVRHNLITAMHQGDATFLIKQQEINPIYGGHPNPRMVLDTMQHRLLREKLLWLPEDMRK